MNITINNRIIGPGQPTYIVAEMSANHGKDLKQAIRIIKAAKDAGADAIKIQTYTPDTLTIDCSNDYFRISGTLWDGKTLYDLYGEAYTPWEWQAELKDVAESMGMDFFSTPFDFTAVDFLEELDVPVYKVASFEIVDLPLLRKIASTGKPIIVSVGMASLGEIEEAVQTIKKSGNDQIALLKCTSAYPSPPEDMNLNTISHLAATFSVPPGLSDHTLGTVVPVAAVALGACIIEKHFTIDRSRPGPDSAFSLEPDEFKAMVKDIRTVEKALGNIQYGVSDPEAGSRVFRRSLFVVRDMKAGEPFTQENVRSIRPGYGMHTRYFEEIKSMSAAVDIERGTPLNWNLLASRRTGSE
ncbi:MAG: pseudaminic acid synthase [Desulfobulbaceae bacterium]|nr:pseudaminic acid synthase [Desulfobulbaceae bacterium]MCK5544183.1 pseudaminic acid synthase [Desulfobulbaceae bacterium]